MDPEMFAGGGQFGAGLGSIIGSFFGGDPYKDAGKYLNQVPDIYKKYLGPYAQEGINDLPFLRSQYGQLVNDPGGFIDRMGAGYKESPGFKYNVQEATRAANQAAAAGGMLGTPAEQAALAKRVSGMASQDYNDYLNHVLGAYGQGLSGYGHLEDQGFDASGQMANSLANYLASRAKLAEAQGQSNQQKWGGIGGFLGSLFL